MIIRRFIILIFLFGLFLPLSFASAGTVLSSYKYAWSNNAGYISFENLIVNDSVLSGYAWSQNYGWIKFNPAQGGVFNDGNGNLSGYAWGEKLGWIGFNNVTINSSTGKFSGVATGTLVGSLTFDCSYCDVRTDWQPGVQTCTSWVYTDWGSCSNGTQTRSVVSSSPSDCTGGSPTLSQNCVVVAGGSGGGAEKPSHVSTVNSDLVIDSEQSGQYTKDTDGGKVVLTVPAGDVSNKTTFFISETTISTNNNFLISPGQQLINSVFYDVFAKDQSGNFIHTFNYPITISLPVPVNLQNIKNLAVYWLNETNWQWVLIPDAIFTSDRVTFQVNHLTKFAIFGTLTEENVIGEVEPIASSTLKNIIKPKPFLQLPLEKKINFQSENLGELRKENKILNEIKKFFKSIVSNVSKVFGSKQVERIVRPEFVTSSNIVTGDKEFYISGEVREPKGWFYIIIIGLVGFVVWFILFFLRRKNKK